MPVKVVPGRGGTREVREVQRASPNVFISVPFLIDFEACLGREWNSLAGVP